MKGGFTPAVTLASPFPRPASEMGKGAYFGDRASWLCSLRGDRDITLSVRVGLFQIRGKKDFTTEDTESTEKGKG
jgi:hypothetical protein